MWEIYDDLIRWAVGELRGSKKVDSLWSKYSRHSRGVHPPGTNSKMALYPHLRYRYLLTWKNLVSIVPYPNNRRDQIRRGQNAALVGADPTPEKGRCQNLVCVISREGTGQVTSKGQLHVFGTKRPNTGGHPEVWISSDMCGQIRTDSPPCKFLISVFGFSTSGTWIRPVIFVTLTWRFPFCPPNTLVRRQPSFVATPVKTVDCAIHGFHYPLAFYWVMQGTMASHKARLGANSAPGTCKVQLDE